MSSCLSARVGTPARWPVSFRKGARCRVGSQLPDTRRRCRTCPPRARSGSATSSGCGGDAPAKPLATGGEGGRSIGPCRTVVGVPDPLTSEQRSRLMSRVRTRNTAPEVALRRALWLVGVRGWRLHPKDVPGQPDLIFRRRRLAVFVDGAFWHGHPDCYWGQSGAFWDAKIARNRARDARVNAELDAAGWTVLRLWDFEVEKDPVACAKRVRTAARMES